MKKILSIFAVLAVASSAFAQGAISFSAPANSLQFKATVDGPAANVPANGGFVSLLWAPAGSAATAWNGETLATWLGANTAWKQFEATAGTPWSKAITSAGRLLNTGVTLPTTAAVDLILIGWTGTATSFDAAYTTTQVDFSDKIANITPAVSPAPPTSVSFAGGLMMTPMIPEPSTFALAGLGAAAMLIFRRRK